MRNCPSVKLEFVGEKGRGRRGLKKPDFISSAEKKPLNGNKQGNGMIYVLRQSLPPKYGEWFARS